MSDTREKYFDENGLYDENEEFLLIKPKDEYKEAYFNLSRESFLFIDKLYEDLK